MQQVGHKPGIDLTMIHGIVFSGLGGVVHHLRLEEPGQHTVVP